MLWRYINGASVLAVSPPSVKSTPRRSSHVGRLHGADGTTNPIFGNRSSPDELESGDGHDPPPWVCRYWVSFEALCMMRCTCSVSSP